MANAEAEVAWRDGRCPCRRGFDDPYFSLDDGLAETRHVFLDGNDLPAALPPRLHHRRTWRGDGAEPPGRPRALARERAVGTLHYAGSRPIRCARTTCGRALAVFPEVADGAELVARALAAGPATVEEDRLTVTILPGDARRDACRAGRDGPMPGSSTGSRRRRTRSSGTPALLAEVARAHRAGRHAPRPIPPRATCAGHWPRPGFDGGAPRGLRAQAPHDRRPGCRMTEQNTRLGIYLMVATTLRLCDAGRASRAIWRRNYNVLMIVMIRYWFFAAFVMAVAARQSGRLRKAAATRAAASPDPRGASAGGRDLRDGAGLHASSGWSRATRSSSSYPLLIAALSGPVLGEKVGWRRWTAIAIGFVGVLIMLQPGCQVFSPVALIPLLVGADVRAVRAF